MLPVVSTSMVAIETLVVFSNNVGATVISAANEVGVSPARASAIGVPSAASAVSSCCEVS